MSPARTRRVVTGLCAAVGVDSGLKPSPSVHQLAARQAAGDFARHRAGRFERDFVFRDSRADGIGERASADIANRRALLDVVDFFGGFDEPRAHRRAGDVFESASGQRGFEFVEVLQRQGNRTRRRWERRLAGFARRRDRSCRAANRCRRGCRRRCAATAGRRRYWRKWRRRDRR